MECLYPLKLAPSIFGIFDFWSRALPKYLFDLFYQSSHKLLYEWMGHRYHCSRICHIVQLVGFMGFTPTSSRINLILSGLRCISDFSLPKVVVLLLCKLLSLLYVPIDTETLSCCGAFSIRSHPSWDFAHKQSCYFRDSWLLIMIYWQISWLPSWCNVVLA